MQICNIGGFLSVSLRLEDARNAVARYNQQQQLGGAVSLPGYFLHKTLVQVEHPVDFGLFLLGNGSYAMDAGLLLSSFSDQTPIVVSTMGCGGVMPVVVHAGNAEAAVGCSLAPGAPGAAAVCDRFVRASRAFKFDIAFTAPSVPVGYAPGGVRPNGTGDACQYYPLFPLTSAALHAAHAAAYASDPDAFEAPGPLPNPRATKHQRQMVGTFHIDHESRDSSGCSDSLGASAILLNFNPATGPFFSTLEAAAASGPALLKTTMYCQMLRHCLHTARSICVKFMPSSDALAHDVVGSLQKHFDHFRNLIASLEKSRDGFGACGAGRFEQTFACIGPKHASHGGILADTLLGAVSDSLSTQGCERVNTHFNVCSLEDGASIAAQARAVMDYSNECLSILEQCAVAMHLVHHNPRDTLQRNILGMMPLSLKEWFIGQPLALDNPAPALGAAADPPVDAAGRLVDGVSAAAAASDAARLGGLFHSFFGAVSDAFRSAFAAASRGRGRGAAEKSARARALEVVQLHQTRAKNFRNNKNERERFIKGASLVVQVALHPVLPHDGTGVLWYSAVEVKPNASDPAICEDARTVVLAARVLLRTLLQSDVRFYSASLGANVKERIFEYLKLAYGATQGKNKKTRAAFIPKLPAVSLAGHNASLTLPGGEHRATAIELTEGKTFLATGAANARRQIETSAAALASLARFTGSSKADSARQVAQSAVVVVRHLATALLDLEMVRALQVRYFTAAMLQDLECGEAIAAAPQAATPPFAPSGPPPASASDSAAQMGFNYDALSTELNSPSGSWSSILASTDWSGEGSSSFGTPPPPPTEL